MISVEIRASSLNFIMYDQFLKAIVLPNLSNTAIIDLLFCLTTCTMYILGNSLEG